ncbi:MAG: hypothetical protein Q9209_000937 [Squamulea sp. 1 TL-2023]
MPMATASPNRNETLRPVQEPSPYLLLSSFYGPGAIGGWYLTGLAYIIYIGLNRDRRNQDSITSDLIAFLTFPTVAAAHLISQVRSFREDVQIAGSATIAQHTASMEAALVVIEAFLIIDCAASLIVVCSKWFKRGFALAITGFFCLGAECYLFLMEDVRKAIESDLTRPFLLNFGGILLSLMVVSLVANIAALGLMIAFFILPRLRSKYSAPNLEMGPTRNVRQQQFVKSGHAMAISWMTTIIMPLGMAATMGTLSIEAFSNLPSHPLQWLCHAASNIFRDIIPRSDFSVQELDQAVALFAGASVLGFRLCSTVKTQYRNWFSGSHNNDQLTS